MSATTRSSARTMTTLVRSNSLFFVTAGLLLLAFLLALRLAIMEYLHFGLATKHDTTRHLEQHTLPQANEDQQVIVALLLSLLEEDVLQPCSEASATDPTKPRPSDDTRGERPACETIDYVGRAFVELSQVLHVIGTHSQCSGASETPLNDGESPTASAAALTDHLLPTCQGTTTHVRDSRIRQILETTFNVIAGRSVIGHKSWHERLSAAVQRLVGTAAHADIYECQAGQPPREYPFGPPGCDAPDRPGRTKLLVASRQTYVTPPTQRRRENSTPGHHVNSQRGTQAGSGGSTVDDPLCITNRYPEAILSANDFSLLVDDLLAAYDGLPTAVRSDRSQVVQIYYLSPHSTIRYWDIQGRAPLDFASGYRLWGANPFVRELLESAEDGRLVIRPRNDEPELQRLAVPYVDYGHYGLVRTECVNAVGPDGALHGTLCFDYSIPLLARERGDRLDRVRARIRSGSLYRYDVIQVPFFQESAASECSTGALVLAKSDSPSMVLTAVLQDAFAWFHRELLGGSWSDVSHAATNWTPAERGSRIGDSVQAVCRDLGGSPGSFIEEVQSVSTPGGIEFVVPIGLDHAAGRPAYNLLLFRAEAPDPPRASVLTVIVSVALLLSILLARVYYEKQDRPRAHEEALLRDLQVGVVDTPSGFIIQFANDRAEEILGYRLPTLGAEWDLADPMDFDKFVHEPFLRSVRSRGLVDRTEPQHEPLSRADVQRLRELGLTFEYYARLRQPRILGGQKRLWLRVSGSPILSSKSEAGPVRTFAVIHLVSQRTEDDLNATWPPVTPTSPTPPSTAVQHHAARGGSEPKG